MRDPRIDPRAGDVVEIQPGDRYVVSDIEGDLIAFVYHSTNNPGMSGITTHRFLSHWQDSTRGARVVVTAQEPAHVG